MFKHRHHTGAARAHTLPVGLPPGGHLLVTGPTQAGKTHLIRELIWFGCFGNDAHIRIVTDFSYDHEYAAVADRAVSVEGGPEAVVAAVAAARSIIRYRQQRDTVPAGFLTPEVVVLDIPGIIMRLTHPSGPQQRMQPALEMLEEVARSGADNGVRVVLAAFPPDPDRYGPAPLGWFADHATTITVDHLRGHKARVEQTPASAPR